MNRGTLAALGAYVSWGLLPVYWKALDHLPPLEVLGHRVVWSLLTGLLMLAWLRHWRWLRAALKRPALLLPFVGTAALLSVNWFTYIWATTYGYIVEASLGYFINPLLNVLLGMIFLHERLRPWQWAAVAVAGVGVSYLTWSYGGLPWVAVSLALTFGFYGLIRKTAALGSVEGFSLEMGLMFVPAFAYLVYLSWIGVGSFGHTGLGTDLLLALAGLITAIPLVMFAYGAQRVTMTTLGILQYAAPTLQFLLGVFAYHESFDQARLIGFSIIWVALALYTFDGLQERRRRRALLAPG